MSNPISTEEASSSLGVTCRHVRHLIQIGELRATRLGRDWLLERALVAKYRAAAQAHDERRNRPDGPLGKGRRDPMDPHEIRKALRQQPFVPFRLHVLDGTTFDIKHPDELLLTRRSATVALPAKPSGGSPGAGDDEDLPERSLVIAILHISRLEELPALVSGNGTA